MLQTQSTTSLLIREERRTDYEVIRLSKNEWSIISNPILIKSKFVNSIHEKLMAKPSIAYRTLPLPLSIA